MLQIGVHHGKNVAAGDLPSAQNRGGQVAPVLAADGLDLGKGVRQSTSFFPRAIGTVVIHDNNFVSECGYAVEHSDELLDDRVDVGTLVKGGKNQRKIKNFWSFLRAH